MSKTNILQFPGTVRGVRLLRAGNREALWRHDVETAYERGKQDGERALSEQLVQQRAEVLELQTGVLTALKNTLPKIGAECEAALVKLALEVARKIVSELPVSAEQIEAAIHEARSTLEENTEHAVLLHPEDIELLKRVNSPLLLPAGGRDKVRFEPSPKVSRGGCLVETKFGTIDARRETKLAALEKELQP